jgi:uracil-DNA glycosylase
METIEKLILDIQAEAQKEYFPIDLDIYTAARKIPTRPILYAGNLMSEICFFGRDLGRDEVFAGQPLIGAAGQKVRDGFYQSLYGQKSTDRNFVNKICCDRLLLTNTVPYKPPGNKAYTLEVKERFRPFIERLLVKKWHGNHIITLGTEAFKWFAPYGDKGEILQFFQRDDKYVAKISVNLTASYQDGQKYERKITLMPLPHPSPLNQRYYAQFPKLLENRLDNLDF